MEGTFTKSIMVAISVVIVASIVSAIVFTVYLGTQAFSDFQSGVVTQYSEAGLSMMVDAKNLESLDAANVYKMMEVNRNIIKDFSIIKLDGSVITSRSILLQYPTERYSVVITGDSVTGFYVFARQVAK